MRLLKKSDSLNQACPWLDREWLETDGKGGYCSSTVPLCNTRKYHGLLVSPLEKLEGRYVLLSGYEISVSDESGKTYMLDTNQYPGAFYPAGFIHLERFDNSVFPEWVFRAGESEVAIEIFMTADSDVYLVFENRSGTKGNALSVVISPVIAYRDSHSLTRENSALSFSLSRTDGCFRMFFYEGMPPLDFLLNAETEFTENRTWLKNREYFREMERGFEFREDCFVPGSFNLLAESGKKVIIRCGCADSLSSGCSKEQGLFQERDYLLNFYTGEKARREAVRRLYKGEPAAIRRLRQESRHFLVKNRDGSPSVIAGYPWFGEWGRDTMISLPGLTACCGKTSLGIEILEAYASYIKDGLVPNTLGGAQGFESYNSIDAGLLYIWAAQQLWNRGSVKKEVKNRIFPAVENIIKAYLGGKVPGLVINSLGFPEAGDENTQLTWMDAKSGGRPVTPRWGSPVEITALFYNALEFYNELLTAFGRKGMGREAAEAAGKIKENFITAYWIPEGGYLADVVRGIWQDRSLRPNMLYALAVSYPLLDRTMGKRVLEITERELLTPCGLRTLSPGDPAFCATYQGNGDSRDGCYHQGTVWPWLLGIYTDAALYAADDRKAKALEIERLLLGFLERHIDEEGSGFVSEIFDGLNPGSGKGAYAQAWSCAEIIRAWEKTGLVKDAI